MASTRHEPGFFEKFLSRWTQMLPLSRDEETVLVERVLAGDLVAKDELVGRYHAAMKRHVSYKFRITPDEAEDYVQDAWLSVFKESALRNFNPSRGNLKTYLVSTAEHAVIHKLRKDLTQKRGGSGMPVKDQQPGKQGDKALPEKNEARGKQAKIITVSADDLERTPIPIPEGDSGSGEHPLSREELRQIMNRLQKNVSATRRLIFSLYWVEGMTAEEITITMGMTVGQVRKHVEAIQKEIYRIRDDMREEAMEASKDWVD